jgi:hypothetical protein
MNALKYSSPEGELMALLPASTLSSEKDAEAWAAARENYAVEEITRYDRNTFAGYAASTVLVRIRRCVTMICKEHCAVVGRQDQVNPPSVIRGGIQMHTLASGDRRGPPVVHTSSLNRAGVTVNGTRATAGVREIAQPAVMLPRVGRVTPEKICVFRGEPSVSLSDCVFAVLCGHVDEAVALRAAIVNRFDHLISLFGGTGAPYLTKRALETFIAAVVASRNVND